MADSFMPWCDGKTSQGRHGFIVPTLESTVQHPGMEGDEELEIAERTEVRSSAGKPRRATRVLPAD
ncbi:hypothetical protein D3870_20450 [Noviherbaspirillum cavernae]|uniref:Uncharacterized protein n=1 Tax=Noviherbaspirillum cavernae TaxID=2320862 RepID=A0A418WVQ4_9BURK|nr:hypothetical protein [Noviherbaspirillum cavernae]RJF96766.1 hypothetical protein D3870_20450 [Noviherbaspirillum cavernae]